METIGSVLDKLCILEKRISILNDNDLFYKKNLNNLDDQRGYLFLELGRIFTLIGEGKHPISFPKNKQYDKDVKISKSNEFLYLVSELKKHNNLLWDLEDKRRDKTLGDPERLMAADAVSIHNKRRNDTIDLIDKLIMFTFRGV